MLGIEGLSTHAPRGVEKSQVPSKQRPCPAASTLSKFRDSAQWGLQSWDPSSCPQQVLGHPVASRRVSVCWWWAEVWHRRPQPPGTRC